MRVCVLGSGVTGVTTAYYLARAGCDVDVVERHPEPGYEASFANGGQLSYSYVAPLADPGLWPKLPAWLLMRTSPLRFLPRLEPQQWAWSARFLLAANRRASRHTTRHLSLLGHYSRTLMQELISRETPEFDYRQTGKLVLYRSQETLAGARRQMAFQASLGADQRCLGAAECVALEPALAAAEGSFAGGIYTPSEEAGDCQRFCAALAQICRERYGVRFHFGATIQQLRVESGKVLAVSTDQGDVAADAFVCALGMGSLPLLRDQGVRLPLYPLQGYSLTLPMGEGAVAPNISVTDMHHKIVYAPLGNRLRVAGMVDLLGLHGRERPDRIALLRRQAPSLFPLAGDYDQAESWTGRRPATPSSRPLLGASPLKGLWLNTGHGALGFTFACASGRLISDAVTGGQAELDLSPYRLNRS